MGILSEQLKTYLESEEGQLAIQKDRGHAAHVNSINEKWIEKFRSLPKEKKIELLYKLKKKYESEEYKNRFAHNLDGFDYPLYRLLWKYAEKYCRPVVPNIDETNTLKYDILGKFILVEYDALFSLDYELQEAGNTIIPHEYPKVQYIIKRYSEPIFETYSEETLSDCIAQIFEKKLDGYTYTVNGECENRINVNGTIETI